MRLAIIRQDAPEATTELFSKRCWRRCWSAIVAVSQRWLRPRGHAHARLQLIEQVHW
ncbi:MAG: hypothetical protein IPJ62_13950 [Betaproteobacteria bacterium]|nr:hypothetical protein [Betaproteobacteria bacterium]